jgi:putative intracellular protease/amidase
MGGPMGVRDAASIPFLAAEMALLRAAVERELPVLGVCLGAQLLAAALGAPVEKGDAPEVGLGEARLTVDGRSDPVLGEAGPVVSVLATAWAAHLPHGVTLDERHAGGWSRWDEASFTASSTMPGAEGRHDSPGAQCSSRSASRASA